MIDKNMSIAEVVARHPETMNVFLAHRIGCIGCRAALFEDIEQGAKVHGIDLDTLLRELNKVAASEKQPGSTIR